MDLVLPFIILVAKIVEASMETIRTVYISRGHKYLASGIGIVKTTIWLVSTGIVLTNLTYLPGIAAYVAGFGIGTLLGMEIEKKIGIGNVIVRIISPKDPEMLMQRLGDLGFGITRVNGCGRFTQTVAVLLLVIPRKEESRLLAVLQQDYPDLLFTIEDISTMSERKGYFGNRRKHFLSSLMGQ
ncbi:MAG TPA: DUF5698 domain-containing protein [Methanoregulaceae archaeon]|nr:DUF5698 domain-containing protein [Methanoregulaceae archaeon]HPD74981.1 DUF5698 domain-containing protein [Methanoregulaceae archaeon]HRY75228.1 DUF5698 domain-containing protein [Methanoregulaceae archaeon]